MSLRPSRRSVNVVPKVKLGERQPLPEPAEEMGVVEVDKSAIPYYGRLSDQPLKAEMHGAANMLSSLQLDGTTSGYTTPSLSRDGSFDDDFVFDSEDDFGQGRCWQLSGDTGSSGFGNSVASFMSWTDDVEVETTKKVQELVDQLERCLYGEESLDALKKEVAEECSDWRNKFPHFRVKGTGISASSFQLQRLYKNTLEDTVLPSEGAATCVVLEDDEDGEEEEIIASHGSYQEEPELHDTCNAGLSSRPDTAESVDTVKYDGDLDTVKYDRDLAEENLKQKVKDAVMEQLFSYVWSEVSKNLEPLFRTLYSRPDSRPSSSQGPNSRRASPKLPPAVDTSRAFTPISDIRGSDLDSALHASKRSVRRSARKTSVPPSLEPSYEVDESVDSYFITDPVRRSAAPPIVRLPQPLSLHSANQVLAPVPTSELRGYHSAADRRTRTVLNRRFSSVTSEHERFLKPLEEQQMVAVKSTATPRQASAPSSPPNWSRHVTLPPIEQLDPSFKLQVLSSSKRRSIEDNCTNSTSAKQKLQDLCSKMRSVEVSPRTNTSAKQKISLTPIGGSAPIRVQGTSLSNLELAKQLLEKHEDLIFESNGLTPTADDKIFKQKFRAVTRRK